MDSWRSGLTLSRAPPGRAGTQGCVASVQPRSTVVCCTCRPHGGPSRFGHGAESWPGYCENEQNQDLVWGAQPAPAEAFWRSVCNSGLLTAHKLPRQLRLVEPEPTRPPSRPAETGAAHPGLKTVLGGTAPAAPAASATHFFGRRVYLRAAQAARPAPSAPPDQGASGAGACAAPTRPSYRRAPADPALALAAGKRAVRAPAAVRPLGAHGAGAAGAARRPAAAAPPGRPPTGAAGALPAAVRAGRIAGTACGDGGFGALAAALPSSGCTS